MAAIIGSQQVVEWNKNVVIKGFSMLMVVTRATADMIVWHLLISEKPGKRISYIDPRLDVLGTETTRFASLRMLEGKRHAIGWCSRATDFCGHATANQNVKPSGLRRPPASIVIDRLYLEAGADVIGGVNMTINKKEQPFWLKREDDYPSLLKWASVQPIVFYDVEDRRAWLTDGASALLHLLRVSLYLDENDPESTYDWIFDAKKLKDQWNGLSGRQAALKTLKSWDNLDLNVYIAGKHRRADGVLETEYYTLEKRVKKILRSIEILIDRQVMVAFQDGIRISQTLDPRRDIVGFDILDVIAPLGPICPCIKPLNSWSHGWIDLVHSVGITTIFGRGFGDLIRPDGADTVCKNWNSVPSGMDYMAASVSTLHTLYSRRLLRAEPDLTGCEMTSKIIWTSPHHPFKTCNCIQNQGSGSSTITSTSGRSNEEDGNCHDPVQFLVKKSWPRIGHRGSTPVSLASLDGKGAVVFGHVPLLGWKSEGKSVPKQHDDGGSSSTSRFELMTRGDSIGLAGSESSASGVLTGITVPSLEVSGSETGPGEDGTTSDGNSRERKRRRWWDLTRRKRT
ncbi:hypothetical protein QQX98_008522 [Neonectria punicea]|uniref:Uncharacterized protein n=1 Tax=Neonectria punicea TaxID=979145 RepID=A0ABR1GUS0_9HYPO